MNHKPKRCERIALRARQALLFSLFLLVAGVFAPAHAQFLGYESPQTVTQLTNTSCNAGDSKIITIPNLGQTTHYVNFNIGNGNAQAITVQVLGISGSTAAAISPVVSGINGSVVGSGYYPVVEISFQCPFALGSNSQISINYSGTSVPPVLSGALDFSTYDQLLGILVPANADQSFSLTPPPFGNLAGYIVFRYTGAAGPGGSTISVVQSTLNNLSSTMQTFTPVTTSGTYQVFAIPPASASAVTVSYHSGGASAAVFQLEYIFAKPGTFNLGTGEPVHITGTTATVVKAVYGTLLRLAVNTPAAGTISIFDLPAASCTGTPSTNTKAVITATATAPLGSIEYNSFFNQGICVQASVGMDLTVTYQ